MNGSHAVGVIDAETLTREPEETLQYVCREIGVEWDAKMLSWKKGKMEEFSVEEFSKWPGFHNDAENCTGFQRR